MKNLIHLLRCVKIFLKETGVVLLPGSDFGFDEKKLIVRLSFTDFDGQVLINEYEKNYKLDDDLIIKFAPKIAEGVDKLKKWSETI